MRNLLFVFTVIFTISSCATTYKKDGFGGGYTDMYLGNDQYRIDVRGNEFTTRQRVKDIALLRAAIITIEKEKEYFIIVDSNVEKSIEYSQYSSGNISSTTNYYFNIVIKISNNDSGLNAKAIIDEIGPRVGYLVE